MTLDEIKALASAKIAGQGDAVDLGGALPAIIDALADAIASTASAAPKIGIVTEDLSAPVEITSARYNELANYAILRYDGQDYIVCDDATAVGGVVAGRSATSGGLFTHQFLTDDTGMLDACEQLAIYTDGAKYYIEYIAL